MVVCRWFCLHGLLLLMADPPTSRWQEENYAFTQARPVSVRRHMATCAAPLGKRAPAIASCCCLSMWWELAPISSLFLSCPTGC